jgi:tetratricopeptide (TPR) repeat protein
VHALDVDNEIAVQFAYFVAEVKAFGAMDRRDINRVAQNVLVPIFNEIYGYSQLRNLDVGTGGNFPGIDLADDAARVAVQVTSTPTLEKVKHTLEQFLQDRPEFEPALANRYDRVIIYILTEKQKSYSQQSIDSVLARRFSFDASRDIWDSTDLLRDIQGLSLAKKEAVLGILKGQLGLTLSQLASTGLIKVPEGMRTAYFVGRGGLLEQVHAALAGNGAGRRIVVLTGMGGIGKTQAALEYVLQHRATYMWILWSSAESEAGFLDSLKSLAHALLPATRRVENPSDILAALARWMNESGNTNWLLVVDGADFQKGWTQARLKALLPASKQGKLLVTSQYQDFSAFPDAKVLPVDVLSAETAVELLLRLAQRDALSKTERDAAGELARMLGRLPIALEQAAAYVRATGLSFREYKNLLHEYGLPVLPADFDHTTDYQHSVQTVCHVALEAVRERSPTAMLLLEFMAFLSAESNCLPPLMILVAPSHGPLFSSLGVVRDPAWISSELLRLVRILHNYSLLTADHDKATIRVHRVVQMATRGGLTADKRRAHLGSWSSILGLFLKGEANSANWDFIESWFPHARSVAESVVSEGATGDPAATFLERLSAYLEKHAQYQEAREFAARAVMIRESEVTPARPENYIPYAKSLICLAIADHKCNEGDKAIDALNRAIDILRDRPEELSSLAAALANLATVYSEQGDFDRAESLLEQVLNDPRLRSAANRKIVFVALTSMALIASKRKDYEKAVVLSGEAVAVLASDADPDKFNLANAYNNHGVMLAKYGRFDEAQANYERALELFRTILPESHPLIANLENNLGYLFFRRGVYGKAMQLIVGSVLRLAKAMGADSPTTQQAARNYLDCVEELKKKNMAVISQEEIETGEYEQKIDSNTIGMVVISSEPMTDEGESALKE